MQIPQTEIQIYIFNLETQISHFKCRYTHFNKRYPYFEYKYPEFSLIKDILIEMQISVFEMYIFLIERQISIL